MNSVDRPIVGLWSSVSTAGPGSGPICPPRAYSMIARLLDRSLMENRRNWIALSLGSFGLFRVDCALRRCPADRLLGSFRRKLASSDRFSRTQVLTSRSRCWVRFVAFCAAVAVGRSWVRSAHFRPAPRRSLGSFGAFFPSRFRSRWVRLAQRMSSTLYGMCRSRRSRKFHRFERACRIRIVAMVRAACLIRQLPVALCVSSV